MGSGQTSLPTPHCLLPTAGARLTRAGPALELAQRRACVTGYRGDAQVGSGDAQPGVLPLSPLCCVVRPVRTFRQCESDTMNTLLLLGWVPGPLELIIIGVVMLLLFGNRLPSVMRSLGRGVVEFKKGVQGIEEDINSSEPGNSSESK